MFKEKIQSYTEKIQDAWREVSVFDTLDPDRVPKRNELWEAIWSEDVGKYERLLALFRFLHTFPPLEGKTTVFEKHRLQALFSKYLPVNEHAYHFERKVGSG